MKKIILSIGATLLLFAGVNAQNYSVGQTSVNAFGGTVVNGDYSMQYSGGISFDGQSAVNRYTILTIDDEGTSGITNEQFDISLIVYPNPTTDFLTLLIEESSDQFTFQIFDINGRELSSGEFSSTMQINMSKYQSSTYFIKVLDKNKQQVKEFKVIKK
ncbi:MAG: T9SS type A sorting domain-containing protein [Brumimicrobium sp.]|nr:T9SS type A sorting domain-containing protein [Brumimicrobium sp.]MCO5267410.1 T9SS type A sorting domain-containing protein [Brumimicrobium sp.]